MSAETAHFHSIEVGFKIDEEVVCFDLLIAGLLQG